MKKYLMKTLHDAFFMWLFLATGIVVTSSLYAILVVAGVSKNNSLLVAFISLMGLILLSLFGASKFLTNLRKSFTGMSQRDETDGLIVFKPIYGIYGLIILLVLSITFPLFVTNSKVTFIAILTLLFAVGATGWNIFSGYTGYISLGHAVFYGLGAYAMAILCKYWQIPGGYLPFLIVPLAGLIAGVSALFLGWIALRTRRQVFAVITIAMFFILQLQAKNLLAFTNGSGGIFLPSPNWKADFFDIPFYYISLALLLLAVGVSWLIRHSKYGLGLLAIRDDEERALGLGIKTRIYKLVAYMISAVFVGMVGAMATYYIGVTYPSSAFDPMFNILVVLITFLGGAGTLEGPLLGALLLVPLRQYLTLQYGNIMGLDLMLSGGLLLIITLVLPEGLVTTLRRRFILWIAARAYVRRFGKVSPAETNRYINELKKKLYVSPPDFL